MFVINRSFKSVSTSSCCTDLVVVVVVACQSRGHNYSRATSELPKERNQPATSSQYWQGGPASTAADLQSSVLRTPSITFEWRITHGKCIALVGWLVGRLCRSFARSVIIYINNWITNCTGHREARTAETQIRMATVDRLRWLMERWLDCCRERNYHKVNLNWILCAQRVQIHISIVENVANSRKAAIHPIAHQESQASGFNTVLYH